MMPDDYPTRKEVLLRAAGFHLTFVAAFHLFPHSRRWQLFSLIESGVIVRNTDGDADAMHFLRQGMQIGAVIKNAQAAIAKATGGAE